ncbi:MAG: NlpC/P60 family protein [Zymomonas mobilis subsp. pomaceae]|uniref:NLP/P60 protein n=1 Tax=Zymomonas mobilis subsp. pomaceae (strain ATCC 29192 / DSM 22645 / JCM 10191 / CCUG 17912 / NBRC 13757 / NCIMB 11200 / NRRL B-4491 / Barker I) TaxID=579138 RepID=F8EVF3_ZYMMT|nr:NlpC/P60 family protein [Zymomonas mobilis]AEI37360.1 NLP/P60 protein [Zymomonas mobilis subsp. pomaceae ATCC 29192]MDX5948728.1 NlpC/P60 family protein [Zymomonas mobilis subsp. pomaceae]GEB88533.1 peptidase P60 [Zymomonas mobilis subsp. pomaceae]
MTVTKKKTPVFCLTEKSSSFDPRINAFKDGLADIALAGKIFSSHYAKPIIRYCHNKATFLQKEAREDSQSVSQLLPGEAFAIVEIMNGWAWGYSLHDHYVGYLPLQSLILPPPRSPSYIVTALQTPVFSAADIKSQPTFFWSIGCRFSGEPIDDFIVTEAGYIHKRHACLSEDLEKNFRDPAGIAEKLVGLPYLWGGRGWGGIDCSGLIQVSLMMTGRSVPRDSDMQQAVLGKEIAPEIPLLRGDCIFFSGHVGMMLDEERIIHANGFWMAVTIENLSDVVARLSKLNALPILARRRL